MLLLAGQDMQDLKQTLGTVFFQAEPFSRENVLNIVNNTSHYSAFTSLITGELYHCLIKEMKKALQLLPDN